VEEFFTNINFNFSNTVIENIESVTKGQSENTAWFQFRKETITASKSHEIKTKMEKFITGKGGYVNMWSLCQKISGLDIPVLKYGREMEKHALNAFFDIFKQEHKNPKLINCGLFLDDKHPFIGASPDGIIECTCHGRASFEIKGPYSISHKSPTDPDIKLPFMKMINNELKLNTNHKYYTQYLQQMATKTEQCYFFVYTSHGHFLETVLFDNKYWCYLKSLFIRFYAEIYLPSIL